MHLAKLAAILIAICVPRCWTGHRTVSAAEAAGLYHHRSLGDFQLLTDGFFKQRIGGREVTGRWMQWEAWDTGVCPSEFFVELVGVVRSLEETQTNERVYAPF